MSEARRRPSRVRPRPRFSSSSLLALHDLQLPWQLHPRPGVLPAYAHTSSTVLPKSISDVRHDVGGSSALGPASLRYSPSVSPVVRVPDPPRPSLASLYPPASSPSRRQRSASHAGQAQCNGCLPCSIGAPNFADAAAHAHFALALHSNVP